MISTHCDGGSALADAGIIGARTAIAAPRSG
jgi:hypothetical protein